MTPPTGTHYERLGVAADATPAEVRAAYRSAARRLHPDANGSHSSAAMADVNQAWWVLGNEHRRRDYDQVLGTDRAHQAPSAARNSSTPPGEHDTRWPESSEPLHNPLARYQDPPRIPWRFMAVMASLGILVVILGLVLQSPATPLPIDNVLAPGSCVVVRPNGDAAEVDCAAGHDGVVEVLVPTESSCPPGSEPHRDQQGMGTACIRFAG